MTVLGCRKPVVSRGFSSFPGKKKKREVALETVELTRFACRWFLPPSDLRATSIESSEDAIPIRFVFFVRCSDPVCRGSERSFRGCSRHLANLRSKHHRPFFPLRACSFVSRRERRCIAGRANSLQLNCLVTGIQHSTCDISNQTCVCTNEALQDNVASCVSQNCTVKQSLCQSLCAHCFCRASKSCLYSLLLFIVHFP